ncbi:MAG TPA: hypothetical protein VMZ31_08395 [Phycisphaerae bacterium]|nr:hypothetical protein [Phycisphaerae bacterium]
MYVSPRQQNRALLLAVLISSGFILLMGLLIAWVGRSWDSLVMILLLLALFGVVLGVILVRHWMRRRWLVREGREWADALGSSEWD